MKSFLPNLSGISIIYRTSGLYVLLIALSQQSGSVQAQTCSGTDPGGMPAANGLYSEYYAGYFADNQNYFSGKSANKTVVSPQLNFTSNSSFGDLVTSGAASGTVANPDYFTGRYRGSFYVATGTTYTFYLYADDAAYLWLDNDALTTPAVTAKALINNGGAHSATTVQASVYLAPGYHNLLVHYGENAGDNVLRLSYSSSAGTSPGTTAVPIPQSAFCTALQPLKKEPTTLTYSPRLTTLMRGTTASSAAPTVGRVSDDTTPAYYELTTPTSGITIDPTTGVLTAASSLATGTYTLGVRVTTETGTTFANTFTFSVVDNPSTNCTGTNPGGGPASNGLYARYYPGYFADNQDFFNTTEYKLARIDTQPNFATSNGWGMLTPPATGSDNNPDAFSARYQGSLLITTPGDYTFYLTSDDASFMWLDNASRRPLLRASEATINNGSTHSSLTKQATVNLAAGKHDLVLHYGEQAGGNILVLEYESAAAGIARTAVPATAFCSATTGLPLPVELTRFTAQIIPEGVVLDWTTASEKNSAYFEVESSADGRLFEPIGRVAGAGTTSQTQFYQWRDRSPRSGLNYYRLHQVDQDGVDAYSPLAVVTVINSRPDFRIQLFPNPVAVGSGFRVRSKQAAALELPAQLTVLDAQGRTLHTQDLPAGAAIETTLLLPNLPNGLYLVRLRSAVGIATERLLVQ
jgi:hypothetical protein